MAIDPIQFQGFTERQGFDPIKVPDPNPFLRENLNVIDASLSNLERGNLANMRAKADVFSKNLAQLSDFSQTLTGFMTKAAEIYDKKEEAAANALYYEDLESQTQDTQVLEEGEAILQQGDGLTSKAAVAANRNGAPYSVSKRIAELGGLKGHYYRIKATEDLAAKYGDYYDEARLKDDREITFGPNGQYKVKINENDPTEVEESAIRAYLRQEYLEQFSGISRGMLAKYAFPAMRKVDEVRASANADRIALRDSERERMESLEIFQQTAPTDPGAFQKYIDTVSRTSVQTKDGKVTSLQYGGAWKQIQTDMLALAQAGTYLDLEGLLADAVNPDTGKKYLDDPVYSTKIKAIQKEIKKAQYEAFNDKQSEGVYQVKLAEEKIVATFNEFTTDSDYEAGIKALDTLSNDYQVVVEYSLLNTHRQKHGQTALQVKAKMQMYEMQAKAGLLDPKDLLTEPPEIQKAFLELAKNQKDLRENSGGYEAVDKELKALILQHPFIREANATGASGGNSNLVYDHVVTLHRRRTNELIATPEYQNNPTKASIAAFKEIKATVTAGLSDPNSEFYINRNGFENFLNRSVNLTSVTKANRRLLDINKTALTKGKSILDDSATLERLIGRDTIQKASDGWGKPGYKMDPTIFYLASRLNVSPLNVIHRSRAAFGMSELPSLRELSTTHENANPTLKRVINDILAGSVTQNYLRRVTTKDWPARPTFSQPINAEGNLGSLNSVNHPFFVAIGVNEGTRTANGGFTKNYYGHTDPGDGHWNRGTVSGGRGSKKTPEQVDKEWQSLLAQTQSKYANTVSRFASPGTTEYNQIMFNILDLRVQAPATVEDFVKRIPQIIAQGTSPDVIAKMRAESFINPRTGRLEASGFGNDMQRLLADQRRRAGNFRISGGKK